MVDLTSCKCFFLPGVSKSFDIYDFVNRSGNMGGTAHDTDWEDVDAKEDNVWEDTPQPHMEEGMGDGIFLVPTIVPYNPRRCTDEQSLHAGNLLHMKHTKSSFHMDLRRSANCLHGGGEIRSHWIKFCFDLIHRF